MMHAAMGCLIALGGWSVTAALLSAVLQVRYGLGLIDTLGPAALAGLAAWVALNLLRAAFRSWRDLAVIASGGSASAPADGARAVQVAFEVGDPDRQGRSRRSALQIGHGQQPVPPAAGHDHPAWPTTTASPSTRAAASIARR
jgi:hypothetical protein